MKSCNNSPPLDFYIKQVPFNFTRHVFTLNTQPESNKIKWFCSGLFCTGAMFLPCTAEASCTERFHQILSDITDAICSRDTEFLEDESLKF